MSTSSALILYTQPHRETAIMLRPGAGLTVYQAMNFCGGFVELGLNAMFRGPKGPKDKIDKIFSEYEAREGVLDELFKSDRDNLTKQHKKLRKYCRKLLEYADARSHTISTQFVAFKMLVAIITRYPGIRRLFYHPEDCGEALSTFKKDWTRAHQDCGEGWKFYLEYTLHCLSDSEISALVEKALPSELGLLELSEDARDHLKVPIEELLSVCRTIPEVNYTKLSAIRYLAGILELPTFWNKGFNVRERFSDILTSLCHTIVGLIQDTGECEDDVDVDLNDDLSAARDATDFLASATFDGLLRLHECDRLVSPCPSQLPNIVHLLQRSGMEKVFPKASGRVSRVDKILQRAEGETLSSSTFPDSGSSSPSPPRRVHPASQVDPVTHSQALVDLLELDISREVIEYVVDSVAEAVDFAMGRNPAPYSLRGKSATRRPEHTEFITNVLTRAEVTTPTLLVALVYIDRAKPHLHIGLEQWALERLFLGSIIVASKYLDNPILTNVKWSHCTGVFSVRDISRFEREYLDVLNFELGISQADLLTHHQGLLDNFPQSQSMDRHHPEVSEELDPSNHPSSSTTPSSPRKTITAAHFQASTMDLLRSFPIPRVTTES